VNTSKAGIYNCLMENVNVKIERARLLDEKLPGNLFLKDISILKVSLELGSLQVALSSGNILKDEAYTEVR